MLKAIKIRVYPNLEQQVYISKLLGSCRFLFNNCLAHKIEEFNKNNKSLSFSELGKYLVELKSVEEYKWLKESHSKVLQQTLINLDTAYKNFFKNGNGFPKFKSKKDNKYSCRFPNDAIGKIKGNRINIIKPLSNIHFKCSKSDEIYLNHNQKQIKSATLTKDKSGDYYFSILIEDSRIKTLLISDNILGIDLGIKDFVIDSNDKRYENIKTIRNNQKKLARLNRELSRKQYIKTGEFKFNAKYNKDAEIKLPSKNREKCRIKLAKYNQKLANQKEYYLHSVANQLLNENQVIVMEDLNVNGMLKNHKLAKSIQELSLNRFKTILTYKSEWYGRDLVQIDRFFPSSKLCNCCGYKKTDLTLKDREWVCPECGVIHDRDLNAAINIKKEGQRILSITETKVNDLRIKNKIGLSSPELTSMESSGYTLGEIEKECN